MSNPKFHRWHHANHPDAIDKNFFAEFNLLDWISGTSCYPKGKIPSDFGSKEYSINILIQHYRRFLDCYNVFKKDDWFALFKNPEASKAEKLI